MRFQVSKLGYKTINYLAATEVSEILPAGEI
jgi:hypothetical protein